MIHKANHIFQFWKGYKAISEAFGSEVNHSENHYLQMEKSWKHGEPSQ